MKNILFRISILTGVLILNINSFVWGQNCQNLNPSSNPNNLSSYPSGDPVVGQNKWDWTTSWYGAAGSFNASSATPGNGTGKYLLNTAESQLGSLFNSATNGSSGQNWIQSPFWQSGTGGASSFAAGNNSDFRNENGWELISRNFGFIYDESAAIQSGVATSGNVDDPNFPYFLLYNRYTGVLRVFGVIPHVNVSGLRVDLSILTANPASTTYQISDQTKPNYAPQSTAAYNAVEASSTSNSYWKTGWSNYGSPTKTWGGASTSNLWSGYTYNGMLNQFGNTSQALDLPTNIYKVSQFALNNSGANGEIGFIFADFPLSYDPCICNAPGGFLVEFYSYNESQISMSGSFLGTQTAIGQTTINFDPMNPTASNQNAMLYTMNDIDVLQQQLNAAADAGSFATELQTDLGYVEEAFQVISTIAAFAARTPSSAESRTTATTSTTLTPQQVSGGFGGLATVLTSFSSQLTSGSTSDNVPYLIQGGISLTGTSLEFDSQPNSSIFFTTPGSAPITSVVDNTIGTAAPVSTQEFYNIYYHIPDYPKYNEPLGVFALLNTPTLGHFSYQDTYYYIPNGIQYQQSISRDEFLLTSPIQYQINPAVHPNLSVTTVQAAYMVVLNSPALINIPGSGNGNTLLTSQSNLTFQYTGTKGESVYISPVVPLNELYSLPISNVLQSYASSSNLNPQYTVYLKLFVHLVSNDISIDGVNPNQSFLMYTYPVTIQNSSTSFSNIPTINPNNGIPISIPSTFTIPNDVVFWNNTPPSGYSNSTLGNLKSPGVDDTYPYGSFYLSLNILPGSYDANGNVQGGATIYSFEDLTVQGSILSNPAHSASSPVTLYSLNGPIEILPRTSANSQYGPVIISPNCTLKVGNNQNILSTATVASITGNYSTVNGSTSVNNITNWCNGSKLTNQGQTFSTYSANTLALSPAPVGSPIIATPNNSQYFSPTPSSRLPSTLTNNNTGNLSVYPNPFANNSTITYTLPNAGNVELAVYDILGEKVKVIQNGFQSSGDYTLNLQSGNLATGVYLVRINSDSYSSTQRIVIAK